MDESELIGNAFILLMAGHETTANALHFSLVLLALHPESQKKLQREIDETLQGKPTKDWTYEEEIPRLFNGLAAAVINETLRLYQPVINLPKSTLTAQPLTINGRQYIIPADTHVSLSSAVHRNPRYWPPVPDSSGKKHANDLNQFRPERWFLPSQSNSHPISTRKNAQAAAKKADEEIDGPTDPDTSAHLFKPPKGSYIPFSDGYRSCIGRKFAQVELLVALAAIFREYSVELAVDEFATDEEVEGMQKGGQERRGVWEKARERGDWCLNKGMTSGVTLQMKGFHVPLRVMRRGEERFF